MFVLAISIVYDGRLVPSARAPRLVAQTTMVPLRPYITRLSARISVDPRRCTISIGSGSRAIVMHVGSLRAQGAAGTMALRAAPFVADHAIYVPLAVVARELGASVWYAPASHAVFVEFEAAHPLASMTPFNSNEPSIAPTRLFTAQPTRVERPVVRGTPHPRRTPIPATPSRP